MGPISISFGLAALAVVALSLLRGRRHPSFRVAVMLLLFWGVANLTGPWVDPWMDTAGYLATFVCWFEQKHRRWALILWMSFGAQLVVHLAFIDAPYSYNRVLILNLLFAVQLMAAAFPGTLSGLKLIADQCGRLEANHPEVARVCRSLRCALSYFRGPRRRHRVARLPPDLGGLG